MRHKVTRISGADLETLAAFRYALRRFLRFSEEAAATAGLPPQQYVALLAIRGSPERDKVTVGVLAERMQVAPNSAVGLANRLARRGLLRRRSSPRDGREVHLVLTARGERALRRVAGLHRGELTRLKGEIISLLRKVGH